MTTNKKTSGITIEIISFKWNVFPYQTEHKNVQLQGLGYQLRALMICTFVYIKYTHKLISKLEIVNYFSFNWIVKPCYNWSFYQFNGRKKLPPASLWLQNSVESESKGLLYAAKILWIEFNVWIHRVDLTEPWRTRALWESARTIVSIRARKFDCSISWKHTRLVSVGQPNPKISFALLKFRSESQHSTTWNPHNFEFHVTAHGIASQFKM